MDERLDLYAVRALLDEVLNQVITRNIGFGISRVKPKVLERIEVNLTSPSGLMKRALEISRKLVEERLKGLSSSGYEVGYLDLELTSPGIVGIATGPMKLVFEVGLNIDPIIGLPYYPGSSIKGVARKAVSETLRKCIVNNKRDKDKVEKIVNDIVDTIFGKTDNEARISLVTFLDAYPIGCSSEDCSIYTGAIVTPHYYREGKPVETELDASPIPVPHIAIAPGLIFRFIIGVRKAFSPDSAEKLKEVNVQKCGLPNLNLDSPRDLLRFIAIVLLRELNAGSFARGKKGYNVFEPYDGLVQASSVRAFGLWRGP